MQTKFVSHAVKPCRFVQPETQKNLHTRKQTTVQEGKGYMWKLCSIICARGISVRRCVYAQNPKGLCMTCDIVMKQEFDVPRSISPI